MLILGRRYFEKAEFKHKQGITYVILAPLLSIILICSPITNFLLFAQPFVAIFDRTAEITMLSIILGISTIIMFIVWKPVEKIHWKDSRIIWVVPFILHVMDIIYALVLNIEIAYIPIFVFGTIHMLYIMRYLTYHPKVVQFVEQISKRVGIQTKVD